MPHLALSLMGPFQASLDNRPVEGLNSNHLRALLAYLAVESGREHPREQVAALLWPERSDPEALSALRFALSKLHSALADRQTHSPFLLVTRTHIKFNPASDHRLDLAEFRELSGRAGIADLERAATLYRGPFLDGLSVAGSPAFEEWMLLQGEEIQRSLLTLLDRLAALHMHCGETGAAAHWARRQLELDPYREQAHRQLMTALALDGERSAALAHYEACRRLLAEELGCEPEAETRALFNRIRDGSSLPQQIRPVILSGSPRQHTPGVGTKAAPSFVAREAELARLSGLLAEALAGEGGMALISGEPGSGKTALLDEFTRQAGRSHPDLIALRGRCNAHSGAGDPYLPFREILQTLAGDVESKRAGGMLSPEQARRVWEALPQVGVALVEHGPDLIDSFVPGETLLQRLEGFTAPAGAERRQQRLREAISRARTGPSTAQPDLFAQVTQVLHVVSVRVPLLLAIDDLQWADGGTLALLFHLGRRLSGSRILLVCAGRPQILGAGAESGMGAVLRELVREWGDVLTDLDGADGQAFVEAYIDGMPNCLGADFRKRLYDHTGGSPLFTVELLRSFQRQGTLAQDEAGRWVEAPGLDWDYCPPRVEAVIAGHLAALPDEDQALLQAAAVQGEQFAAEVVARVLARDEQSVVGRLSGSLRTHHRLVEAFSQEWLGSRGQRLSHYRFRHALVQRSAYSSLDVVERALLHEATGRTLEAIYAAEGGRPQSLAPALARHYEAAGLRLEAARALHDAGQQAIRLGAYREALRLFDHGLALQADEAPSARRNEIEQLLKSARLLPLSYLDSLASPALVGALRQANEAGAGKAQGRPRLLALKAEAEFLFSRGQFEAARTAAEEMLAQAIQSGDESFQAIARWQFGVVSYLLGHPQEAESHFDWCLAWLTPERRAQLHTAVGLDLLIITLTLSALERWLLGYPEQARSRCAQALATAFEGADRFGQVIATAEGCMLLFLLRSDPAAIQEQSELCYRLCQQHAIGTWQQCAEVFLGWLAVMGGEDVAGLDRMQRAIAAWQGMSMAIGVSSLVLVLADGCLAAAHRRALGGETAASEKRYSLLATGLAAIEPLLGPVVISGQSLQPELYRLKGELLLERDGLAAADEVLACFQQSLQLGQEMGALSWKLRTAMSLVRLRERQGEEYATELAGARTLLRDLYALYTEGFSFPDLQEAAALISESGDTC